MDVFLLPDTLNVASFGGLGFAKFLIRRHFNNQISISDSITEQSTSSVGVAQISAVILNALAPPPVKRHPYKTAPRLQLRQRRRMRRRLFRGDDGNGEEEGFSGDGSDNGFFGRGYGGGGGGGGSWNFDRFGGQNWDDSSSYSGFAVDFIYEVIYWIALSNCVHFAFKKFIRILADAERAKVPLRLTSVC